MRRLQRVLFLFGFGFVELKRCVNLKNIFSITQTNQERMAINCLRKTNIRTFSTQLTHTDQS